MGLINSTHPTHSSPFPLSGLGRTLHPIHPHCEMMQQIWKEIQLATPLFPLASCEKKHGCSYPLTSTFHAKINYIKEKCSLNIEADGTKLNVKIEDDQHLIHLEENGLEFKASTNFYNSIHAEWIEPFSMLKSKFSIKQDPLNPELINVLFKRGNDEISGKCMKGNNKVSCSIKESGNSPSNAFINIDMTQYTDPDDVTHYIFDLTSNSAPDSKNLGHFECHLDKKNKTFNGGGQIKKHDGTPFLEGKINCTDLETCDAKITINDNLSDKSIERCKQAVISQKTNDWPQWITEKTMDYALPLFGIDHKQEISYHMTPNKHQLTFSSKFLVGTNIKNNFWDGFKTIDFVDQWNLIGTHQLSNDGSRRVSGEYNKITKKFNAIEKKTPYQVHATLKDNEQVVEGQFNLDDEDHIEPSTMKVKLSRRLEETDNVYEIDAANVAGEKFYNQHRAQRE